MRGDRPTSREKPLDLERARDTVARLVQSTLTGESADERGLARLRHTYATNPPGRRRSRAAWWALAFLVPALGGALLLAGRVMPAGDRDGDVVVEAGALDPSGYVRATGEEPPLLRFGDGSTVELAANARGRLIAPSARGAGVRMALEDGMARLLVQPRKGRSWSVQAGPYEVRVVGTRFEVTWSHELESLDVRLHEGRLAVQGPLLEQGVSLAAGQHLSVHHRERKVSLFAFDPEHGRPDGDPARGTQAGARALEVESSSSTPEESGATEEVSAPEAPGDCRLPYVDAAQWTALEPGQRSHWLQPWRSHVDTWPARRMREGVGLYAPILMSASDSRRTLSLLKASGVARVLMAWNWGSIDREDPGRFREDAARELRSTAAAIRELGLRPLVLLHGHEGVPVPSTKVTLTLAVPAGVGATRVLLDASSARRAREALGRIGFETRQRYRAADVLISAVDAQGWATLSKPLESELAAGPQRATVLMFEPFHRPTRADGAPNPAFERTFDGWLSYVRAVVREAAEAFGPGGFDLQVWNEFPAGSAFLDVNAYYEPDLYQAPVDDTLRAILERTARWLRDPASGAGEIAVIDGFASTRWSESPARAAPGVTALSRHVPFRAFRFPYDGWRLGGEGLNAAGAPDGRRRGGAWEDAFTPHYDAFFPELPLTAILPATILRDLAPAAADAPAGRGGTWITALGFDPRWSRGTRGALSASAVQQVGAKALLRTYAAYIGKGAEVVIPYPSTRDREFVQLADPSGGPILAALGRFMAEFQGPDEIGAKREVSLLAVESCEAGTQFEGDGQVGRASLSNRSVVAFFPFQRAPRQFVAPVYVMTRDLARSLVPEPFRLIVRGLSPTSRAELKDPLTEQRVAVRSSANARGELVLDVELTDYPRLLVLTE